jgi:hypothetical protein
MTTTQEPLRYVSLLSVDTPIKAALVKARADIVATFGQIKAIQGEFSSLERIDATRLQLDLIRASRAHSEAIWLERTCRQAIERRANELGLTTVRRKAGV